MHKGVIFLAGPTASGKSAAAIALAQYLEDVGGGVIINADSMQVYRELEIITAQPSQAEKSRAPHRLYGVLSGAERCSVARWRELALGEIDQAHAAGQWPILVGGTGLYFKILEEGIAHVPKVPQNILDDMTARHAEAGAEAFYADLASRDPEAAANIRPTDTQRVLRVASVLAATGRTLADWQAEQPSDGGLSSPVHHLALLPPRDVVYARCDARLQEMFGGGALEEVAALEKLAFDASLPIMKAVGVPDIRAFLAGDTDRETALADAQQATRRYAKRQMTWIRNQMTDWEIIGEQDSERISAKIFSFIRQNVLTQQT